MSHSWICPTVLVGILTAVIPPSQAQDLPSALAACRAEKDDARRLACYDREVGMAAPQESAAAAAPQSSEERFGYRGVLARKEREHEELETRRIEGLVATVTGISTRGDGTLAMTFDNGQVWAQNRPDAFFRVKVGEQIKIEPAALGSYMLITAAKRTTRVTRLK